MSATRQELIDFLQEAESMGDMAAANATLDKLEAMPRPPEDYGTESIPNEQGQYDIGEQPTQQPASLRDYILSGVNQRAQEFENQVGGMVEPYMAVGSGMAAYTPAQIGGGIEMMLNPNDPMAGPNARDRIQKNLTYQPRTQKGQAATQMVGETLAPVGEFVDEYGRWGQEVLDAGGPEWLARVVEGAPEYAGALLSAFGLARSMKPAPIKSKVKGSTPKDDVAISTPRSDLPPPKITPGGRIEPMLDDMGQVKQSLIKGIDDPKAAKFKLDPTTKDVIPDPIAIAAGKTGWSDNVIQITKSVATNAADRVKALEMVKIAKKGLKDIRFGASNRPDAVLGGSVLERLKVLKLEMLKAGNQVDAVARRVFKKPIKSTKVLSKLDKKIAEWGGVMDDTGTFQYKAGTGLYGAEPAQKLLQKVYNQAKALGDSPSGYRLHKFKQWVDDQVSIGAQKGEGLVGDAKRFVADWRRDINLTLRKASKEYKDTNLKYSETKKAIDDLAEALGSKRLYGDNAVEATGQLMRRWIGRTANRQQLINAVREADRVATKYRTDGGVWTDTMEGQVLMANALDDLMTSANPLTRSTFKADIGAARAWTQPSHAIVEKVVEKGAEVGGKVMGYSDDPLKALDAIEDLLRTTSK